ncbi:MAG TPA: energy transducer TonB [Polyangiaceae bacterium]|nr:energy transducer TonB [Polyangiaceae bacterium]
MRPSLLLAAAALALAAQSAFAAPGVVPPRRIDAADVPYPADGKGDVTVELTLLVDAEGRVAEVMVKEGGPPFSTAAVDAVAHWRFSPATRGDTPIPARIRAVIEFHPPVPAAPAPATVSGAPTPRALTTIDASRGSEPTEEGHDVVVRGEREEPSTIHLPRSEARLVPGAFGDPFRIIEAMPGMNPFLSGLPYYFVRGAPPESVGYSIDGVPVPLLFHVGAGPSTLSPPLVDAIDLFPAAYPARYGRYAGAIVAGQTAQPDFDRPHAEIAARVFDANAFVETPFDGGQGSVATAGRYSYTGALLSLVAPDYSLGYWDYQARVAHKVWGKDTLSVFAFGAHDDLANLGKPNFEIEYHRADVRYDHLLSDGRLRIAATFHHDDTFTAVLPEGPAAKAQGGRNVGSAELRSSGGRVRTELEEGLTKDTRMRAGADFAVSGFAIDRHLDADYGAHVDAEGGVYADIVWRPTRPVEVTPGVRLDGYRTRGAVTWAPQPRLGAKIKIAPALSWISALGTAHQGPTEEVFVPSKIPAPVDSSARNSYQLSEGVEARLPSGMRARINLFYSRIVADAGQERGVGVEVFLHRDFSQRLGGFVSYALSRSDRTPAAGAWQRSPWDRTHILSAVLSYDLGANWRVGGRLFVESGRTWSVASCAIERSDTSPRCVAGEIPVLYEGNLPAFARVDVRLEKKWELSAGRWIAGSLECFNTLRAAEPIYASYLPANRPTIVYQSPIILPSIGVHAGF